MRSIVLGRGRMFLDALERLVGGLGTALPAFIVLAWSLLVALLCVIGIGVPLASTLPRLVRATAERERARLSRWDVELTAMGPAPRGIRAALADPLFRRELRWLSAHGTSGLFLGAAGATLAVQAVQDLTYPLWWRILPRDDASPNFVFWTVRNTSGAVAVALFGVVLAAVFLVLGPWMARLQDVPGRRLLAPPHDVDLSLRIARLSATRAAALDAHATELRRIERSLHDGTQNRLVSVTVLLGAAHRALTRDPATAEATLVQAQNAAETALAELRTVVRSILPPVLADRGLSEALAALAANCAVPCRTDIDVPGRCAASVEATTYFVAAEALTNLSRHSRARSAAMTVRRRGRLLSLRIEDDGIGGADEGRGSGLAGIRGRVEAHDGWFAVTSPRGGPTVLEMEMPCGS
ncbi:sensor domain-containing protein [Streptomyces sp. SCSIO 75703]|uniref:sensor histidine kinase n=1 Tax=unclassified Streptomyces TaxID=2593676 RepID=UPI001F3E2096|nr:MULTISPECIES: sensor histidine kinase [unclassified Streptomyces]